LKILVLHTLAPETAAAGRVTGEFDLDAAAHNVAGALPGAAVVGVRGEVREVLEVLDCHQPDVVFNACEAPRGRPGLEPHVAALLEWLGVRFTGAGSETLALCRRKDRTNAVLAAHGVGLPRSGGFPCVVKPADEDGSAGIHADSLCRDHAALARALARIAGPAVVQEFLPGREFAVAMWGGAQPEGISIGETRFRNGQQLITYAAKWDLESPDFADTPLDYHTPLDTPLRAAIESAACATWHAVDARGYMRIDMRLNGEGTPCVLDVNPNPELGPGVGICRAVQEAGWTWERFMQRQVELA
jgi:D-alanine-D-alanine ligase